MSCVGYLAELPQSGLRCDGVIVVVGPLDHFFVLTSKKANATESESVFDERAIPKTATRDRSNNDLEVSVDDNDWCVWNSLPGAGSYV